MDYVYQKKEKKMVIVLYPLEIDGRIQLLNLKKGNIISI